MEATALAVTHRADDRASGAVRAAPDAATLGRFVLDVLLRQAEGKLTASPAGWVAARAHEQGIERERAETPFGNLLAILERGAESEGETDVVSAFFARGLFELLSREEEARRPAVLARLLPSLDWLMAYGPYDVYAHVEPVCPEPIAQLVWRELARVTCEEGGSEGRIHRLLRAEVLCRIRSPLREEIAGRLARSTDPVVAAMARAEAGSGVRELAAEEASISGRIGPRPVGRIRRVLSLCTGWALFRTIFSAAGRYLLGFRRTMDVSLATRGVLCKRRVELLGKTIREGEELVPFAGLASIERESRYPYVYLLVGVGGLALGAIWGVLRIFDGIRGAYAPLALIGLGAIVAGVVFDLGLSTLWPARRGKVSLTLLRTPKRWIRIVDVDAEAAHRFVAAVDARLKRG